MNFSQALMALKKGQQICRKGWNGKGMFIMLQKTTAKSKMTLPYIFMSTADGDLVPWVASQSDLLADDWEMIGASY